MLIGLLKAGNEVGWATLNMKHLCAPKLKLTHVITFFVIECLRCTCARSCALVLLLFFLESTAVHPLCCFCVVLYASSCFAAPTSVLKRAFHVTLHLRIVDVIQSSLFVMHLYYMYIYIQYIDSYIRVHIITP